MPITPVSSQTKSEIEQVHERSSHLSSLALCVATLAAAIALTVLVRSFSTVSRNSSSLDWEDVQAVVLRVLPNEENPELSRIQYVYSVDGKSYLKDRIALDEDRTAVRSYRRSIAKNRVKVGELIYVYVDPEDPETSFIIPGSGHLSDTPWFTAGVIAALVSMAAGFMWWHQRRIAVLSQNEAMEMRIKRHRVRDFYSSRWKIPVSQGNA